MKVPITILIWALVTHAQQFDIQDLTNNNGYIPIKTGELKTISHYDKILHFINLTTYDETMVLISDNINTLKATTFEDKQLLDTINKNFILLNAKIANLHTHSKSKRGLFNALGKGLKYIAGSMDSDDEREIRDAITKLHDGKQITDDSMNKLIYVNNFMSQQIDNITRHINRQQILISKYINNFREETQNRIKTLEDEVRFIEQTYKIDNDISLLRNHIDDIGQIIFSSKLGIIPTDILTQKELNLITDFDSYSSMKIVVFFQNNNIILTILIPQFSPNILSKIKFEPLPNTLNKSIVLSQYEILVDKNKEIYDLNVKDNLEKNLINIENDCITNILNFKEAQCKLNTFAKTSVIEIVSGIIIFKNFNEKITHDCNELEIKQKGTFLIKFENCKFIVLNKTYTNVNIKIYETFVLPNLITKIRENNVTELDLKLGKLHLKQLQHENNIKLLIDKNKNINVISFSTDLSIIFLIIIITFILICIIKYRQKCYVSPTPQITTDHITNSKNGPFLQISAPQMNTGHF